MKQYELTNLLPRSAARAVRRGYFVRLISVVIGLTILALIIHGALLMPAYLYAHGEVIREQTELDRISASSSTAEQHSIQAHINSVKEDITYLGRLGTVPAASSAFRAVVSVPHTGIKITGFTYAAPSSTSKTAQMTITGTANTRDQLRQYVQELGKLPYVTNADLPISSYAKDSNIPFTVTLTGSLIP
ncbi:MAG: hypothetical protein JWL75_17 [Parcubacteria group bacterium]|nr:hypothetical protein [Parcubacteria group bacterium]